jgi:lysophospholipase L1-like esterase
MTTPDTRVARVGLWCSLLLSALLAVGCAVLFLQSPLAPYDLTDGSSEPRAWTPGGEFERVVSVHALTPIRSGDIVFAGDSQIAVCPWNEWYGAYEVKNRGIDGDGVFGLARRLHTLIEAPPRQLYILTGANDLWNGYGLDEVLATYRQVLREVRRRAPETEVYVLSTTFMVRSHVHHGRANRHARALNAALPAVASQEDATFLDVVSPTLRPDGTLDPLFTHDGGHLNGAGCAAVAEALAPYVRSALARREGVAGLQAPPFSRP